MKLLTVIFILDICTFSFHTLAEEVKPKTEMKVIQVSDYGKDFPVPQSSWDLLLSGDPQVGPGGEKKAADSTLNTFFSEIEVVFKEKTAGVLTYPHFTVRFPKGGGVIDLAEYKTGAQGTYSVQFIIPKFEDALHSKALFLSGSKKRRVGSLILGSGCNVYFDITKNFSKLGSSEGVLVNTTRHRDVSFLTGHFLFSAHRDGQNYVSQVQLKDSKNSYLECGENHESHPKN